MKYLLLLTNDAEEIASWDALSAEEQRRMREAEVPEWADVITYIQERDAWVDGLELETPRNARTVRVRGGEPLVTDGPYAETKEQIGGFFLVKCDHLDEAIEIASRIPVAAKASVEIRPVVE